MTILTTSIAQGSTVMWRSHQWSYMAIKQHVNLNSGSNARFCCKYYNMCKHYIFTSLTDQSYYHLILLAGPTVIILLSVLQYNDVTREIDLQDKPFLYTVCIYCLPIISCVQLVTRSLHKNTYDKMWSSNNN